MALWLAATACCHHSVLDQFGTRLSVARPNSPRQTFTQSVQRFCRRAPARPSARTKQRTHHSVTRAPAHLVVSPLRSAQRKVAASPVSIATSAVRGALRHSKSMGRGSSTMMPTILSLSQKLIRSCHGGCRDGGALDLLHSPSAPRPLSTVFATARCCLPRQSFRARSTCRTTF